MTRAVFDDWRTAPVDERVRAVLGFLEKMTLRPDELARADAEAVRAAGVSDEGLIDAIHVGVLFNMIVRIADALAFHVPPYDAFVARAPAMLDEGYALLEVEGPGADPSAPRASA